MIETGTQTHHATGRALSAVVAMLLLATWAAWRLVDVVRSTWPRHGGPVTIDEALGGVLAGLALLTVTWLAVGLGLGLLAQLPGTLGRLAGRAGAAVTPVALRKLVALVLGTSLGTVLLPPTAASGSGQPWSVMSTPRHDAPDPGFSATAAGPDPGFRPTGSSAPRPTATRPAPVPGFRTTVAEATPTAPRGSWLPTRPPRVHDGQAAGLLTPAPRTASASLETVTVRRGDTLWSIAGRHLGAAATDAEVARAWPLWHAANRDLIGADPHLILPGQQLVPPSEGLP